MAIDSSSGARSYGEVQIVRLRGEPGIVHRVIVQLQVLTWPSGDGGVQGGSFADLAADVTFQPPGGPELLVGRAHVAKPMLPVRSAKERQSYEIHIGVDLTKQQVAAWEQVRRGRDFNLCLRYRGAGSNPSVGPDGFQGEDRCAVTQSDWARVLAEAAVQRVVLVEVPIVSEEFHPRLAQATADLAEAAAMLGTASPKRVVGQCRLVLEALAHALGEDPRTYNLSEDIKGGTKLTKALRFAALRKTLTTITHLAHHADPTASATDWDYDDAEVLLAQTAAVLRYHASVLNEAERG